MRKRNLIFLTLLIAATAFLTLSLNVHAGTATVNLGSTKQVIRGFGAASVWCGALDDAKMNMLFNTMGLSILRVRIAPNEKWSSGNYSAWADELANAKKAKARGAIVFATPWTPPVSMKTNNNTVHGSLKTSSYSAYANYLKTFANYFKNNGAALYAISIQNEPDWDPSYEGCTWTAAQFDSFIKNYGSVVSGAAKVIMPESLNFNQAMSNTTLNDSSAARYVSIIGGHLYGATIKDYPAARSMGKELWMTEHLLNDQSFPACLTTAKEIHDCLTTGMMNAYVWWWVVSDANGLYNKSGVVQKRGYVLGQYAKFVRNGYYRVDATSNPSTNVYVTGFKGGGKAVIVAINKGSSTVSQSFKFANGTVASVTPYITSGSQNIAAKSGVTVSNGSFAYSLPASSVMTFVGTLK